MNTVERRHEVVQTALKEGRVDVPNLVQKYGVSAVTIRADLNLLHNRGLLVRTRGGANSSNRVSRERSIFEKNNDRLDIKKKLAMKVCQFIKNDDTIILDSGTTTAEVAKCLHSFPRLVVMTSGLNVAQNLISAHGIEVLMTGGSLRDKSLSFYGRQAEDSLQRYCFNKVILGVDGIDFTTGITTHFEYEAILNRRMCEVTKEIIAVTDSSKFNRSGVHRICGFEDVDILVTDSGIPDTFAQTLENSGVRLVIVE